MSDNYEKAFVEWIQQKAADSKERNGYESKSWLLTGASIYPNNISMKMVCYRMAKSDRNSVLSASHLTSMIKSSESDSHAELQEELKFLLNAVQSDAVDPAVVFDAEIFQSLPTDLQCNVLRKAANDCQDVIAKCSLLLLLVKTNSYYAREYGILLIEMLFQAELKESHNNIRNIYRRYFVGDVLPMMLHENPSGTDKKILLSWLDKAFQYYIVTALQSHREGMMSPSGSSAGSCPMKDTRPWESLAALLTLTAKQIKIWTINADHFKSEESLMQYLNGLKVRLSKEYSKTLKREFIYISTYLLLKLMHTFNGLTRKMKATCLIQRAFADKLATPKKPRKGAAAANAVAHSLSAAGNIQNGESLVTTFKSACTAWSMLHSDPSYAKGFAELLDRLDYPKWRSCIANFTKDRIVYQQEYKDYPIAADYSSEEGCYRLQRACCQYALGMHLEACQEILDVVTDEAFQPDKACYCHKADKESGIDFMFISQPMDIFDCGITILISALRERMAAGSSNDDIIGNLCVLSQLHWPKYKLLFVEQIMPKITEAGKFTYPCFFDYISNVEMLEEFAYLRTAQGANVNLQIQTASLPKQRTVTRGVSRDTEEDLKSSFEKQISKSSECIQGLIIKFLIERKRETLAALAP